MLVLTWLLLPAIATLMVSLFIERIMTAMEVQYYTYLPAPVPVSFWQGLVVALKFASVMVVFDIQRQ